MGDSKKYRYIAVEEHFSTPSYIEKYGKERSPERRNYERTIDIGEGRIREMDEAGVDIEVLSLSTPGVEQFDGETAAAVSRETNEILADAVKRHPDRFSAFAVIPTPNPGAAAKELEYAVNTLGFKGTSINGHIGGKYLDNAIFSPILEAAEHLGVPIYIHPTIPPQGVVNAYYTGNFSSDVEGLLSGGGFGWHIETAVHVLRLILSGAFDRFPKLQVAIGHLGEGLPFFFQRLSRTVGNRGIKLERPIDEYLRENLWYTFGGFNFLPSFVSLYMQVGAERILFSADSPFGNLKEAAEFVASLPISETDKHKITWENAKNLFHF
jgi:predicted TIM-barrel fold metal-dependent hydrolase